MVILGAPRLRFRAANLARLIQRVPAVVSGRRFKRLLRNHAKLDKHKKDAESDRDQEQDCRDDEQGEQ
jgi:hypothetical protein